MNRIDVFFRRQVVNLNLMLVHSLHQGSHLFSLPTRPSRVFRVHLARVRVVEHEGEREEKSLSRMEERETNAKEASHPILSP